MNRRLGEFQLLRRLAVGGMSEVYLARRVNAAPDDPLIVIKLLLPQVAQDPTFADMFADEARLAEQLDHPNLVHVIAWGEISGEHFLALEYVDGCSLAELLAHRRETGKAPLTPEIALGITESLLTGLGYLHELSDAGGHAVEAVHRDVTPGNVLLSRHGDLKLADFGIARHRLRKSRTKTGIVKGTLQYMAPEQIADDHIDRRADVYAAGLILFELLTGRPYLEAEREIDLLGLVAEPSWRPPTSVVPALDSALDTLLKPALERFPEQRYPDAGAFARAIGGLRAKAKGALPESSVESAIADLVTDVLTTKPGAGAQTASETDARLPPSTIPHDPDAATRVTPRGEIERSPRRPYILGILVAILFVSGGVAVAIVKSRTVPKPSPSHLVVPPTRVEKRDAEAVRSVQEASADIRHAPGDATAVPPRDGTHTARDSATTTTATTRPRTTPPSRHPRRPRPQLPHRRNVKPKKVSQPPKPPPSTPSPTTTIIPPRPTVALRHRLTASLARLHARGILLGDLQPALQATLQRVRKAIADATPNAEIALATLDTSLSRIRVGAPLVKAKLARVHRRLRTAGAKKSAPLAAKESMALQAYMDGRLGAANAELNTILAALGVQR